MNRTSAPRVIVIDKTIFRTVIVKIQYASTDVISSQPAWVTTALQTSVMHVCHGWQHIQAKIYLCLPGLVPCYMRGECGNSWHLPYAGASWWENFALHRQYFFEWATNCPELAFAILPVKLRHQPGVRIHRPKLSWFNGPWAQLALCSQVHILLFTY